jgi:hypothetical protein
MPRVAAAQKTITGFDARWKNPREKPAKAVADLVTLKASRGGHMKQVSAMAIHAPTIYTVIQASIEVPGSCLDIQTLLSSKKAMTQP